MQLEIADEAVDVAEVLLPCGRYLFYSLAVSGNKEITVHWAKPTQFIVFVAKCVIPMLRQPWKARLVRRYCNILNTS